MGGNAKSGDPRRKGILADGCTPQLDISIAEYYVKGRHLTDRDLPVLARTIEKTDAAYQSPQHLYRHVHERDIRPAKHVRRKHSVYPVDASRCSSWSSAFRLLWDTLERELQLDRPVGKGVTECSP